MPAIPLDINGPVDKRRALQTIEARNDFPFRVAVLDGAMDRSQRQNRLLHKWFREVADYRQDVTDKEVKAECNLLFGVPILCRDDDEWRLMWEYIAKSLNYEFQIKLIRRSKIPITSEMTMKQLNEYMTEMEREYAMVNLTNPEDLRYG